MSDKRRIYPLIRLGNLLLLRASLSNQQELRIVQLLIDTGLSFTVLPNDVLTEIGCSLEQPWTRSFRDRGWRNDLRSKNKRASLQLFRIWD